MTENSYEAFAKLIVNACLPYLQSEEGKQAFEQWKKEKERSTAPEKKKIS